MVLPENDKIVNVNAWTKLGIRTKKRQTKDKSKGEKKKTGLCFEVMGAETKLGETRGNKKG